MEELRARVAALARGEDDYASPAELAELAALLAQVPLERWQAALEGLAGPQVYAVVKMALAARRPAL